ncbi:hypothetical protein VST63_11200 [Mycolicibacterium sp. 050232]|uniref:hypothetical protein n=1 Tax=Mycolicibacterium sp. 050232 TaxID=3113982 RepID=UPI002E28D57D|nr:hypothetical protein [Mycolicibacterium sp. 050232]MED5812927.1 hypothetical protein [Mycolicibacterium sp. 050232]
MTTTTSPVTKTNAPLPIPFDAPLANPSPIGLYAVTAWTDETGPPRWLMSGVQVRRFNCGLDDAFGVWPHGWCDDPGDDIKTGVRPDDPDPFNPVTVWAFDECDLTEASRNEVDTRVQQIIRLRESFAVEAVFGSTLTSRTTPEETGNVAEAVAWLDTELAKTGLVGYVHAAPWVATLAQEYQLIVRSGGTMKTPLGNIWVFGAGYTDSLGEMIVATTQPYGWRDQVVVRPTMDLPVNTYAAVAERSVVMGVECVIAAAQVPQAGLQEEIDA